LGQAIGSLTNFGLLGRSVPPIFSAANKQVPHNSVAKITTQMLTGWSLELEEIIAVFPREVEDRWGKMSSGH
jgi:hypothetical protein